MHGAIDSRCEREQCALLAARLLALHDALAQDDARLAKCAADDVIALLGAEQAARLSGKGRASPAMVWEALSGEMESLRAALGPALESMRAEMIDSTFGPYTQHALAHRVPSGSGAAADATDGTAADAAAGAAARASAPPKRVVVLGSGMAGSLVVEQLQHLYAALEVRPSSSPSQG